MAIQTNSTAMTFLSGLIRSGDVNTESGWSFSAEDGNMLLGENGDDWANFAKYHLAIDTDENENTKLRYKFPVGKNGEIYRSGVIAAKQRAGGEDYQNILSAADRLLNQIDEPNGIKSLIKRWTDKLFANKSIINVIVDQPQFKLYEQSDGQYRWIGIVTNKFEDRENEILTDSAHKEFLQFLTENPEHAPELWIWHTLGTARENKADWWDYKNGFFVYSGLLTLAEAQPYFDLNSDEPVGMSHGFFVLEREGKYITKYRTFEVSELSHSRAANPYTAFMVKEEILMNKEFSPDQRAFMVDRIGEEAVTSLEQGLEDAEKVLTEAGTNWKELNEQYEVEMERLQAEKESKMVDEIIKTVKTDVVAEIVKALNVKGLQEALTALDSGLNEASEKLAKVDELEEKVTALLENEDRRIAKALVPDEPFNWLAHAASKSDETIVEDDDAEAEMKSVDEDNEYNWLKSINLKGVF